MNIIEDDLKPRTFGEFIDALIISNIRMWHAQEIVYDLETLESLSRQQMFDFLKEATWLNLMRNSAMDAVDSSFSEPILAKIPNLPRQDCPLSMTGKLPLWEKIENEL